MSRLHGTVSSGRDRLRGAVSSGRDRLHGAVSSGRGYLHGAVPGGKGRYMRVGREDIRNDGDLIEAGAF